jgi:hypothetical protein
VQKNSAGVLQVIDDAGVWAHVAALIAIAIGLTDLWGFHRLQVEIDLGIILAALGAMGLKVAFNAGRSLGATPDGGQALTPAAAQAPGQSQA